MGGIYSGLFTPTEAAAMSAVWAFIAAVFIYKDLSLKDVPRVLLASANMSAMLLYIITDAMLFSFLMTHENIPQAMADGMLGTGVGLIGFLLIANLLLLAAGNFMEPSSIVLILAPILFPIAMKLGIDPVHFGILMVVNMEIGMCHPPSASTSTSPRASRRWELPSSRWRPGRGCSPCSSSLCSSPTFRRCRPGCRSSSA